MNFADSLRDIKRMTQIVNVLFQNGLGYFLRKSKLSMHLPFTKKIALQGFSKPDQPEAMLRESMEELGGSFVKLGQLLSLRPDLVPLDYCKEFSRLQDRVKPFSFSEVRKIVEAEIGGKIEDKFSSFEKKPIGSASISQVHLAKLKNGKKVVVKVRRPGVKESFAADIDIMKYIAGRLEHTQRFGRYSPSRIIAEFEKYTKKELNFIVEANHIEKFRKCVEGSSYVKIPRVYSEYTTPKLIVQEYIPGKKLAELLENGGKFDKKKVAQHLMKFHLKMVYEHGMFHADLHPGNILVTKKGIGLLDYGIAGRMKEEYKIDGLKLYVALINEDIDSIARILMKVGKAKGDVDFDSFRDDIEDIIAEWYDKELRHVRITHVFHRLFDTSFEHNIRIPTDLVLYGKSLITLEGTALRLYPSFNFTKESQTYFRKYMKKPFFPADMIRRFSAKSQEIGDLLERLPSETLKALEKLKQGKIKIDIEDTDIKHLGLEIDRSSNRLAYALVIASLILGGAWALQIREPQVMGYPALSSAFFIIAFLLGVLLMVSIYREGKTRY